MDDNGFMDSRYWQWCKDHTPFSTEQRSELQQEATAVLIESVNRGEILTLDGVDTPISKMIRAHHGAVDFEMNSNWIGSSQDWSCPCCSRTKFQLSRIGKKGQILAKSVVHHDHMGEAMQAAFHRAFDVAGTDEEQVDGLRLVERMGIAFAAYQEVLICEDCNNADTEAKKLVGSPSYFSFSINQISQFILYSDHRPHTVVPRLAEQIWELARPAYELRMKLISVVAKAAATDAHWYEPYARGRDAVPVFGVANRPWDNVIRKWVSPEALFLGLGPKKAVSTPDFSRWRTEQPKIGKPLPSQFLAMLRSDESHARSWAAVGEDWLCPVCRRNKFQIAYVGGKGKIIFSGWATNGRGHWASVPSICSHCKSTLMSLKLEITKMVGETWTDSYGFVTPEELTRTIIAQPHSPNQIRQAEAAALVNTIVDRLPTRR